MEENVTKKGRHRKKQLYNSILELMEFYFSDSNLNKDRYLSKLLDADPYVELSVFLRFNKIRQLTNKVEDVAKALSKSAVLKLSEDGTRVCRTSPVSQKADQDECTIYIERLPADTEHDWLKNLFTKFGKVDYVSIPKYRLNKMIKGFAFIEFGTPSEAEAALKYFESIGCKMPVEMPPDQLASIATFEPEHNENVAITSDEKEAEPKEQSKSKKRKLVEEEGKCEAPESDVEDKPTKKKRKRNKSHKKTGGDDVLKQLSLQVLSKREWKQLRNKYLNLQRVKMKQLKEHLHRSHNANGAERPPSETEPRFKFTPESIVHVKLSESCSDIKKLKTEIKAHPGVQFVDVQVGSDQGHVRFSSGAEARKFCESVFGAVASMYVLQNQEETDYWDKITADRSVKLQKDVKKQRGRDKLLKKAERELGKHIRFDSVE